MRLSRNRNWGHPDLVAFLERLAEKVPKVGWPGLLVGDMAQPRGGPMLTGHASHQVGLDADIWLTPMPDARLDARGARGDVGHQCGGRRQERRRSEDLDAAACRGDQGGRAQDPKVERIFVNAAIKKALCREAGNDRALAAQGAPLVGAQLSFPRPHRLSGRTARNARRRIRRRRATAAARNSTTGSSRDPQSAAAEGAAEAAAADHDGGPARRVQTGAAGAVRNARTCCASAHRCPWAEARPQV